MNAGMLINGGLSGKPSAFSKAATQSASLLLCKKNSWNILAVRDKLKRSSGCRWPKI